MDNLDALLKKRDELDNQRDELDKRIRILQGDDILIGKTKIRKLYGDSYAISLLEINHRSCNKDMRWKFKQIVIADTKEEALSDLKSQICSLISFYDTLSETPFSIN